MLPTAINLGAPLFQQAEIHPGPENYREIEDREAKKTGFRSSFKGAILSGSLGLSVLANTIAGLTELYYIVSGKNKKKSQLDYLQKITGLITKGQFFANSGVAIVEGFTHGQASHLAAYGVDALGALAFNPNEDYSTMNHFNAYARKYLLQSQQVHGKESKSISEGFSNLIKGIGEHLKNPLKEKPGDNPAAKGAKNIMTMSLISLLGPAYHLITKNSSSSTHRVIGKVISYGLNSVLEAFNISNSRKTGQSMHMISSATNFISGLVPLSCIIGSSLLNVSHETSAMLAENIARIFRGIGLVTERGASVRREISRADTEKPITNITEAIKETKKYVTGAMRDDRPVRSLSMPSYTRSRSRSSAKSNQESSKHDLPLDPFKGTRDKIRRTDEAIRKMEREAGANLSPEEKLLHAIFGVAPKKELSEETISSLSDRELTSLGEQSMVEMQSMVDSGMSPLEVLFHTALNTGDRANAISENRESIPVAKAVEKTEQSSKALETSSEGTAASDTSDIPITSTNRNNPNRTETVATPTGQIL